MAATAFTHASWAEDRPSSYERLEFLGDSVLELAIAHVLYERNPEANEGALAKARANIVSRSSCAIVAGELELGDLLAERMPADVPEEARRLPTNRNVLAALLEAALGALFLEHGFAAIEEAVVDAFAERIDYALNEHVEYKTELQEAAVRLGKHVSYTVIDSAGPPHDRRFRCAALVDGTQLGVGEGRSKKEAEQAAAREALAAVADIWHPSPSDG
ncbi:MAG TPA: ribonuclease III [Gaiellaceae bacterium]|nr:ribonuclease III [Gaiellaceae bacterium]